MFHEFGTAFCFQAEAQVFMLLWHVLPEFTHFPGSSSYPLMSLYSVEVFNISRFIHLLHLVDWGLPSLSFFMIFPLSQFLFENTKSPGLATILEVPVQRSWSSCSDQPADPDQPADSDTSRLVSRQLGFAWVIKGHSAWNWKL